MPTEPMNRLVVLAARPVGLPKETDFALVEEPIPEPAEGEFLVRNHYISVDPYMRGRMRDVPSYVPAFRGGQPLEGGAVGQVIRSRHPDFAEGAFVTSHYGWREYWVSNGEGVRLIDPSRAPISAYLGALGMPGFTGWYGLREIGRPQAGETLVVSAAAGAVGSVVGQIGKIVGCRVVGTAGTDAKCAWLTDELGFDAAINYRNTENIADALRAACPNGIDVYYENVGGPMLDAVLQLVNRFARIPVCGMISQYNDETPKPGPRFLFRLITQRVRMQGFIISDHWNRYGEFLDEVGGWLRDGTLRRRETILDGIENAPRAFIGLFRGDNTGKMLVRVGPD